MEQVESNSSKPFVATDMVLAEVLPVLQDEGKVKNHPVVRSMLRKTPQSALKNKGGMGEYLPWSYYAFVLTETLGAAWSTKVDGIEKVEVSPGVTEVIARVRIITPWGEQPGVGSMMYRTNNPTRSWAASEQGAISNALGRAAQRYAIASDVKATTEASEAEVEYDAAMEEWKKALAALGLTQRDAVADISLKLAGERSALPMLKDCIDAVGGSPTWAVKRLVEVLNE